MPDDPVTRFGVTMEKSLLEDIDRLVEDRGYASRSDLIRRLARRAVTERKFEDEEQVVVGTLTLLYEHSRVNLGHELTRIQHDYANAVASSLHVHLSSDDCLEVLVLSASSRDVRELAEQLRCLRGVKFSELSVAASS